MYTPEQPTFPFHTKYVDHLGIEEARHLTSLMNFRKATKQEILVEFGKPVKDVFYVHKGVLRLYLLDENGREVNTHLAWGGMFITSYYSLINNKFSDESVVAVTDAEVFHFKYASFAALFDRYPKIERLGRVIAEEAFSCYAERGRMLLTMTAKERYLRFMESTPVDVFQSIPMQDIAAYLSIAPGSLSRIRNEFLHIC